MRNLKDAKDIYDHIVVPEELDGRLREAIAAAEPKRNPKNNFVYITRWAAAAAAAFFLCFMVGLNTSETFAMSAAELPIIGQIAKVLTIRSYETTEDTTTTKVEIPEIQVETADKTVSNAITDVNAKIVELVEEFTTQKQEEIKEYKDAFFKSGGTEEEWEERSIDVNVIYEVKHQSETMLSLLVNGWISWFNFEEERHFYNINLETGEELTLIDFFGENAYDYTSNCVLQQMRERSKEDPENHIFWGINEQETMGEEFTGVTKDTFFYINEDGNVVITYDKYEVAPGFMGVQEFVIPVK